MTFGAYSADRGDFCDDFQFDYIFKLACRWSKNKIKTKRVYRDHQKYPSISFIKLPFEMIFKKSRVLSLIVVINSRFSDVSKSRRYSNKNSNNQKLYRLTFHWMGSHWRQNYLICKMLLNWNCTLRYFWISSDGSSNQCVLYQWIIALAKFCIINCGFDSFSDQLPTRIANHSKSRVKYATTSPTQRVPIPSRSHTHTGTHIPEMKRQQRHKHTSLKRKKMQNAKRNSLTRKKKISQTNNRNKKKWRRESAAATDVAGAKSNGKREEKTSRHSAKMCVSK